MAEASTRKIGTIKTIEPKMKDGRQETYKIGDDGETMFRFRITFVEPEFEPGDTSGKTSDSRYKAGDKVVFESKTTTRGLYYSIKSKSAEGKGSASTYNDPVAIRRTAMGIALEVTKEYIESRNVEKLTTAQYYGFVKYFYEKIVKDVTTRDEVFSRRSAYLSAIQLASLASDENIEKMKSVEFVTSLAEKGFIMINSVGDKKDGPTS